ncbi:DUF4091 domain-containing protein [Parapedobacter pyrenivorans]|uniref:DUF4091 domain-containing protein n=1 Tax=Parapedobacter pyrenivorans TaxID=1305674 RepID=UPI0033422409
MRTSLFLCLILIVSDLRGQGNLQIYQIDPLKKVLKDRQYFVDESDTVRVARGEYATLQFVLKSPEFVENLQADVPAIHGEGISLAVSQVGFVGYVELGRLTPSPGRDQIISPSGYYPDPIFTDTTLNLVPNEPQPVWITVPIPVDTKPGIYHGTLEVSASIHGQDERLSRGFTIRVYPPVIENTSLWVTNWIHHTPESLSFLNNGVNVPLFSTRYWELITLFAERLKGTGQNVIMLPVQKLVQYKIDGDRYQFDFTNLDKSIAIYQKAGVMKRLAGSHIGYRMGDWYSQFGVEVPVKSGSKVVTEILPLSDERSENFLRQFIPELLAYLKSRGLSEHYLQHVADEPIPENVSSYKAIATVVKKYMPDTKIIDATIGSDLVGSIDVWVPVLDFLHKEYDFYKERQEAGDEVWFYTCLGPQGNYANRFIEQPLIFPRLIHWINYKYGITGYLHWGFTAWHMPYRSDVYKDVTGMFADGNVLPGGDSYLVYPTFNKLYSSLRLEAMRDGINDYELLQQLKNIDPDMVDSLINGVIYNFDHYDVDVRSFRNKRKQLLERLSAAALSF